MLSSVRARLTLGYALAVAVPLAAIALGSYQVLGRALGGRTDHFLIGSLNAFEVQLTAERREWKTVDGVVRGAFTEFRFRDLQLAILDTAGHVLGASDEQTAPPLDLPTLTASLRRQPTLDRALYTVHAPSGEYRVHTHRSAIYDRPVIVAGVSPMHDVVETMQNVRHTYFVALPLLIALAAFGGHLLAGRTLAPVGAMARRAAEISASTPHDRLPVMNASDEFGRLATVVNALLGRLEGAIEQQRRFMADASHELRTPAAIIRTETEVTLANPDRDASAYRESAEVVHDASLRLARIIDDLFVLARADAGQAPPRREEVDLAEVVASAGRAARGIAQTRGIELTLPPLAHAPMTGDEDLLGRMLLNLLDNAIKYAEPGGHVRVALETRGDAYALAVIDDGRGIPADAQARVFDRFYRVDRAQARASRSLTGGAGLGLAIARWAAEANGGQLELVESRPGRTEFRAKLPR